MERGRVKKRIYIERERERERERDCKNKNQQNASLLQKYKHASHYAARV